MNDNRLKAEGRDGELVKVRKEGMKEEGGGGRHQVDEPTLNLLNPMVAFGKVEERK